MANKIIAVLGRKGSGKTYLARKMVEGVPRLLCFDPQKEFTDCGVVITDWVSLAEYLAESSTGKFRIVYQPQFQVSGDEDLILKEFNFVCRCVGRQKNMVFVVDEIDRCINRDYTMKNLIQTGRHSGISIVATTIRYTDTTRDFTAQCDSVISFQCTEPGDVRYFRDRFGDLAEQLPNLPLYHYVRKDADKPTAQIYAPKI